MAAGSRQAVRVTDLSEGGARIADGPAMAAGASGTLTLNNGGGPLPFVVRHAGDGLLHVAFRLDQAGAARVRGILDGAGRWAA